MLRREALAALSLVVVLPCVPLRATDPADEAVAPAPASLGGLQRLYPWPEDTSNLVLNPSFEELDQTGKLKDWIVGEAAHLFPDAQPRTGSSSLHLKDSDQATYTPIARQSLSLAPGWYVLRAWARALNAGAESSTAGGRLSLWGTGVATDVVNGTTDWVKLERRDIPVWPGDTPLLRVEAYQKPPGSVFFDDVALHRLAPPPVEAFVLYPNYRGALFSDRAQDILVRVTLRPEELQRTAGEITVRLSLQTPTGAVVAVRDFAGLDRPTDLALDASSAPLGRFDLKVQALERTAGNVLWEYPPYTIVKLSGGDRAALRITVDPDNAAVIDGQRRFVLGIYDTTGYSLDPAWYEPRIAKIAEAPLNMYINYWLGRAPDSALQALASTLQSHGMKYLHTVNTWYESAPDWGLLPACDGTPASATTEAAYTACRARALSDIPGLAGWYTADERLAEEVPPVFSQFTTLRESRLDGLTFIAQNRPQELVRWRDSADVVGVDPYPIYNIPEGSLSPLETVTAWVDHARQATGGSRPVWAVIQYFPFGSNGHWPTFDELRSMSYMAIVAGARGLLYWSYGAKGLSWVQDPELKEEYWQRLVRVTREIHSLEPVLLSPERPGIVAGVEPAAGLRLVARSWGRARYVIAVNNTPRANVSVTFTLGRPASRVDVVAEQRSITPSETTFTDVFGAYETHVYKIRSRSRLPRR